MENAALPLMNLAILGAFMIIGFRELSNVSREAVRISDDREEQ